ncbi:hypothetical protein PVBG_05045 [Plasmodium vivax Brazil I]|uniref:Variable surface protein n=2 Tax=Plasmodium vivax TaxID=5855 RepID=A0A0J9VLE8_PLAV1|nr:hypothetical protein PVBG_05045 [Plasmodium vivax Brazil I]
MEFLWKYNMKDSLKLVVLLKFFTFMFLIWNPKNDSGLLSIGLETKLKCDRSSNASFNRLLTKYEYKEVLDDLKLGENLVNYETPPNIKNEEDVISPYEYIKKIRPINFFSYKKDYKHRYSKKKRLAKLECYCENKLFQRIDELYEIADSMKKNKSSFKKALFKKYRKHIYITIFFYILGELICILDTILNKCKEIPKTKINDEVAKELIKTIGSILVYVFPTVLLFVIIYISIKFLQYESLKAGRGKMKIKDYFKYCKEVFNLKK